MTHRVYGTLIYLYDHDQTSIAEVTSKTTFLGKTVFIIVFYGVQSTRNASRQKFFIFLKTLLDDAFSGKEECFRDSGTLNEPKLRF